MDKAAVAIIAGLVGFLGGFFLGLPIREERETIIQKAEIAQKEADKAKQRYLRELRNLESVKKEIAQQIVIARNQAKTHGLSQPGSEEEKRKQILAKCLEEQKQFHWERRGFYNRYLNAANEAAQSTIFREAGEYAKDFFRKQNNKLSKGGSRLAPPCGSRNQS